MFADPFEFAFRLLLGAIVIAGLVYAVRPRYVFTIAIEKGIARSVRGCAPRGFVREVEAAVAAAAVSRGKIYGVRRGKHVILAFSPTIPGQCRQQLRNLWQINHHST